jgi:phosphoglycolate phosphatase-like HAD superfamily hydrolase
LGGRFYFSRTPPQEWAEIDLTLPLQAYRTWLFDCDGVILNSNAIKTNAFRVITLPFGARASSELVTFHTLNGGVSRYAKMEYFIDYIVPKYSPELVSDDRDKQIGELLKQFSSTVERGLLRCEVASGLMELRQKVPDSQWMVVSGGDQAELQSIFKTRGLNICFDGGIYGSPRPKRTIIEDLVEQKKIQRPAVLLGDSRLDHEVADTFDLDFVFISAWSEFLGWKSYCREWRIETVEQIGDITIKGVDA